MQFINGCFETTQTNRKKVNFFTATNTFTQIESNKIRNCSNFDNKKKK